MKYSISDKMKDIKPSAIREIFKYAVDPEVISLAAGDPAPESLPVDAIDHLLGELLEEPMTALLYSQSEGHPPFRKEIEKLLKQRYHIGQAFDEVMVTTGAQQCMDLTTKALCNEGDTILCESPSFIGSLNTFRSYGANLVGVPMEADGIDLAALEQALKDNPNTKMIYVIPNFQNPTGITMSLAKRQGVYQLAKQYDVVILEDNPYGDLRFAGQDIPSIKSMDTEGLVVYAGSFSKILSTGMRVGYCMAPQELMQTLVVAKQCTDVHTSMLGQLVCYRYLQQYDLNAHIESLKIIYQEKAQHMLGEMKRYFPDTVSYTRPEGGIFVWVTLPETVDSGEFATRLVKEHKVVVVPGSAFNVDGSPKSHHIRMNFSMPSKEQITTGVKEVAKLMEDMV